MRKGETRQYSEAFKRQVVGEIEKGRFGSPHEAADAYGVLEPRTVSNWARRYGKNHLLRKVVRVEKEGEPGEIKRLKARVRKLEEALADAHMDGALNKAFFEIVCEKTGTDPEEIKKKSDVRRYTDRKKYSGDKSESA